MRGSDQTPPDLALVHRPLTRDKLMLPLFTHPWALCGLLAVPALVAIYWLRRRSRRVPVSSLMLWAGLKDARQGGLRFQRLQTPLLFFLELLALALLALAAAGPFVRAGKDPRPLVVVLDDSYAMRAGGGESARDQGAAAIREELRREPRSSVRFLRAGVTPQVLGGAGDWLDAWKCRSPRADLEKAVTLAGEVGGPRALIVVVTDHAPARAPGHGRLQWWAFGKPRDNLALVNAARTTHAGRDRCLLEVANFSPEPRAAPLVVEAGEPARPLYRSTVRLAPGETRRVVLRLKGDAAAVRARLPDDALEVDNHVTLLREARRPVRVAVRVADPELRTLVEKALRATGRTVADAARPELLFTDRAGDPAGGLDTWRVRLRADRDAEAYAGPFVTDRAHPLTEGLSLRGVIWGAGKSGRAAGAPVILAGNVPLVSDAEGLTGRHDLTIHLRPDLSTLPNSPAWPVLIWNLVAWRAAQAPGPDRANVRLGEEVAVTVPAGVEAVRVVAPDGTERDVAVHGRRAVVPAEAVGRYRVRTPAGDFAFACNALDREASDLTGCAAGRWGEWDDAPEARPGTRRLAWALLLLTLAALTAHAALVARSAGRRP